MIGTRCDIVAQVKINTNPPAQFAIDARITSIFSIGSLREGYGFKIAVHFALSSTLRRD
jgi:hypothetical protein